MRSIAQWLGKPFPLRFLILRSLDRRLHFLPYPTRLKYGTIERANYGYCLLHAAKLARQLGHVRISAIEFGVAGGNGLVALERHALSVTAETGVQVAIYGFDTGKGLPQPLDYRDLPYLFQGGSYTMDQDRLRARLRSAQLRLGPVEETVGEFCHQENPPPIGFISFDLDYYSSTAAALRIFEAENRYFLPRVTCYFDDIVGDIDWAYNEFTGELLAIQEFNTAHEHVKISPVNGLRYSRDWVSRLWHEQIFVAHLFQHADYGQPISNPTQAPLH
jgi:hypothetical protein